MKKNVLIVFTGPMEVGGIERSLIGLLNSFDYSQFNVDLFLYAHHGPLFPLINPNVNLLQEVRELAYLRESFSTKLKHGCLYSAYIRFLDMFKSFAGMPVSNDRSWAKTMRRFAPKIKKQYDIAISFFLPFDFIREKVQAKIKLGWIHTDYATIHHNAENSKDLAYAYSGIDYAVGVSEQCVASFLFMLPEFKNRTMVIENILSDAFIKAQADLIDVSGEMPDDGSIKILSVGRFCDAKNFDNIPAICKKLLDKGIFVNWYLIGFGQDEALIRTRIAENQMEKHVIILGKKDNPYPYMKACDIYVQPSRYEGKCVSVREAQILNKPVVITKYKTSDSQLKDGYDGVIVPMDNDGCADGLASVILDLDFRQKLITHTKQTNYTNSNEIKKLYSLIEST